MSLVVENETITITGSITYISSITVGDNGFLNIYEHVITPYFISTGTGGETIVSGSLGHLHIREVVGTIPGLYDENGDLILFGVTLNRVLEIRNSKHVENLILTLSKEHLQELGLKNRLYFLEGIGTGSNSELSTIRDSVQSLPNVEAFIWTRLIPWVPVKFISSEIKDLAKNPMEIGIIITAIERITGSG